MLIIQPFEASHCCVYFFSKKQKVATSRCSIISSTDSEEFENCE